MKQTTIDGNEGYEDDEPPVEKAFTRSDKAVVGDLKLEPYSPDRVVASQALGQAYGFLDDAAIAQFRKTSVYPGMLRDVINHIWLRSLADEGEIDQAARDPTKAAKKAIKFAEKHDLIDTNGSAFWNARSVFMEEMAAIHNSRVEPAQKKTKAKATKGR